MDQILDAPVDDLRRFRGQLLEWFGANVSRFESARPGAGLGDEVERTRRNQRALWDVGWLRYGWPSEVGGLGGPPILRAVVAEEAVRHHLVVDVVFAMAEVLAPTIIDASPHLAAHYLPAWLRGDEGWCQGFSEPEAGSDLASLRCRAVEDGDGWAVTGEKIWTSYAQFASKMVLLARTGSLESRHRGISVLLVDMDAPGVEVRPLRGMNDQDEFSQISFDGVRVPEGRLIGERDGGWGLAMQILRSERGGNLWMLSARLTDDLRQVLDGSPFERADDDALGHAFVTLAALRARSWTTQHRMVAEAIDIPETSVDKLLITAAEQEVYDLALAGFGGRIQFEGGNQARSWRASYLYSRASSIYGGTSEIQRNIVADRVLGLSGR